MDTFSRLFDYKKDDATEFLKKYNFKPYEYKHYEFYFYKILSRLHSS